MTNAGSKAPLCKLCIAIEG